MEWKRLEEYLQQHLPETYYDLRPANALEQVEAAEHALGLRLPQAYRDSLLRHDGQEGRAPGVIGNWRLLPIQETVREWKLWRELLLMDSFRQWEVQTHPAIRREAWNLAWIPITVDSEGNHHCLDLDPAPNGHAGQVIVVYAQEDRRELVADDFLGWMQRSLRHLEAGNFRITNDVFGIRFDNEGFLHPHPVLR